MVCRWHCGGFGSVVLLRHVAQMSGAKSKLEILQRRLLEFWAICDHCARKARVQYFVVILGREYSTATLCEDCDREHICRG